MSNTGLWAIVTDNHDVFYVPGDTIQQAVTQAAVFVPLSTIGGVHFYATMPPAQDMPVSEDAPGSGTLTEPQDAHGDVASAAMGSATP